MPKVTFLLAEGGEMMIDHAGFPETLMEIGRRHGVPGIIGDCGGFMSCATCHLHIDPDWLVRSGTASANERAMIEMTADPRVESRLGCQLWLTPEMDGLRVRVAAH